MSNSNQNLQHRHVEESISPPFLTSMNISAVEDFLQRYDFYIRVLKKKNNVEVMTIKECLNTDIIDNIEFMHAGVTNDEKKLREYLVEMTVFKSSADAMTSFKKLLMDDAVNDVNDRLSRYNLEFLVLRRRSSQLKLKEQVMCQFYIQGIRPNSIQSQLQAQLLCEEIDLPTLVAKTNDMFRALSSIQAVPKTTLNVLTTSLNSLNISPSGDVASEDTKTLDNVVPKQPPGYELRREPNICRRCGVAKWSREHGLVCKGPPPKSVNSITSNSCKAIKAETVEVKILPSYRTVNAVIDSAAEVTCISRALASKLCQGSCVKIGPTPATLRMPDGRVIPSRNVEFEVQCERFSSLPFTMQCFELPDDDNDVLLIGNDILLKT